MIIQQEKKMLKFFLEMLEWDPWVHKTSFDQKINFSTIKFFFIPKMLELT